MQLLLDFQDSMSVLEAEERDCFLSGTRRTVIFPVINSCFNDIGIIFKLFFDNH